MSNIPEILIHRVVVNGIRMIRENPKTLDYLLPNLAQADLKNVKDFFLNNSIEFAVNYPKAETLKVPAIVMHLQSENESQAYLGDYLGGRPDYDMPGQEFLIDTSGGHGASTSTLGGLPKLMVGQLEVLLTEYDVDTDTTTVYWHPNHNQEVFDAFSGLPADSYTLRVTTGTGIGQKREIINIRGNSLDIKGTFSTQLDSSSLIDIRKTKGEVVADGQPSHIFEEDNFNLIGRGANYETQYQLSIYSGSQYEVVFLYSILKAIFLSQRIYLEGQNIQGLTITGSDFSPKGEYLPDLVYARSMNIRFTYTFSFIEELPGIAEIKVDLTVGGDECSCDEPASTVSFEVTL